MARSLRQRGQNPTRDASSPEPTAVSDRPRRSATNQRQSYQEDDEEFEESITVDSTSPQPAAPASIKLKLKMPPSKLRESITSRNVSNEPHEEPSPAPRPSRARRQVIMESDSDEDDDDPEADEDEEEEDDESEEDDEDDAEGDSDVEMEDAPTPPVIRTTGPASKPTITITSAPKTGKIKSVEAKELSMATGEDYDDDDLSDLSDEDEEIMEEDAIEGEEDAEGDADSFDEEYGSRAGTPDITKMTKRQRALVDSGADDHFMALNMGPQARLQLTDEQRTMRRVEMARRRKNLSEKRNEEEKQDTINRLLKKQAPKRRGKITAAEIAAGGETPDVNMGEIQKEYVKPDAVMQRWVSKDSAFRLGVPVEWKDKPLGEPFGSNGWTMVEEVEV